MKEDRLTAMAHFVAIVEKGSFSNAARALGKTLPALSRSLKALEERLGARLLTRTTRSIAVTEFGQQYYEHCRRILQDIEAAESLASQTREVAQGLVRVTAPLLFGRMHVAPLVAPLLAEHTGLEIELMLSDHVLSMVDDAIDVSIRIGDLEDSSLIAIPLGHVSRVVCAAPAYWKTHGKPAHPGELENHACLLFRGLQQRGWLLRIDGEERHWPLSPRYACNDGAAVLSVARAGTGVIQMMSYQVAEDIAAGKLEPVLEDFAPHPLPVHAVYASGKLLPAKIRTLLDVWVPQLREVMQKFN
jgi:DNA-binding transcriptional LysR family regulator